MIGLLVVLAGVLGCGLVASLFYAGMLKDRLEAADVRHNNVSKGMLGQSEFYRDQWAKAVKERDIYKNGLYTIRTMGTPHMANIGHKMQRVARQTLNIGLGV